MGGVNKFKRGRKLCLFGPWKKGKYFPGSCQSSVRKYCFYSFFSFTKSRFDSWMIKNFGVGKLAFSQVKIWPRLDGGNGTIIGREFVGKSAVPSHICYPCLVGKNKQKWGQGVNIIRAMHCVFFCLWYVLHLSSSCNKILNPNTPGKLARPKGVSHLRVGGGQDGLFRLQKIPPCEPPEFPSWGKVGRDMLACLGSQKVTRGQPDLGEPICPGGVRQHSSNSA